jgi:hypothetical protein
MLFRFGHQFRPPARWAAAAITIGLLISWSVPAPPAAATSSDRDALAKEILDLMRQDLRAEALPLCRSFNELFPDSPGMLYNQACLENTTGFPDQAIATFSRAVDAGFDDFTLAFDDPDLADLKYHSDMVVLALAHQMRLSQLSSSRAVDLHWQKKSETLQLFSGYGDTATDEPRISLTWTPVGLDISFSAAGRWADLMGPAIPAPWNGGPGLVCTIGIPPDGAGDSFQTANHFIFAFGMDNKRALGAMFVAGPDRWQPIAELQPKIRHGDGQTLEMKATIPWTAILPYDPLVDPALGFNATVRLQGPDGMVQASLLPDPAAFRPRSSVRRVVPLGFDTASTGEEIFTGKVSDTVSGEDPVTFDLVAVSLQEGSARLSIDFLGGPDQSLLPGGQVSATIDLAQGLNNLTRQADFSGLTTGAYVIRADLEFPSGRSLTWGSSVLHLAPDWREEYLARIDSLPVQEQPTARFHLESIEEALASHHPRRSPGPIVTTLNELSQRLDHARREGTIFPPNGSFLAVYPGPDGTNRLCHMYLPRGWEIARQRNPVLMLSDGRADMTVALADRIGLNYEQGKQKSTLKSGPDEGFPVYLAPRLVPLGGAAADLPATDPVAEAEACLEWARGIFGAETVSLAGVDRGAATALQLARVRPAEVKAMMIFAGGRLEPWPQAELEFVKNQLEGFPVALPVIWADFVRETEISGQGPLLLEALRGLGCQIVEVQEVRGGLNFTQVGDRTVLWAEGLR